MTARALLLLAVALGGRAAAAPPPVATSRIAVDFAAPSSSRWFVAALQETVARELSRFAAVRVADPIDPARCPSRESRCLVDAYRAAGVDVVVLGRLRGPRLDYEVYATWARGRAFDGSLRVEGVETRTLVRHVGEIVRPIVHRGGLLDERPPTTTPAPATPTPTTSAASAPPTTASRPYLPWLILLALLVFVAFPPLLLRLLVGAKELRKRGRPASWKWTLTLAALLVAGFAVTRAVDVRPLLAGNVVVTLAAGLLWGAFALIHASWVLAPVHGLGHARYDALWPLVQSWLSLALLRATLLLYYAPFLALALFAGQALGLPSQAIWALLLPGFALVAYVWLLTLVDNLALFVDAQLVIGVATARNPWHATIKRYFRGYVRRTGVDLDGHLLDRTLFLPSLLPSVLSYGGGFARPRVLVGEAPREAALGQLPDETELPEHTVNAEELPLGFLAPGQAARDELHAARTEELRHELALAPARARGQAPRLVGENATLLGWVMPQAGDDGVPLISNTRDDYEVVKRLLTEHYSKFERNLDDDEIDDTDPTQKDFLYGALLREMHTLTSRDTFVTTIRLSLALAEPKASAPLRWLIRAGVGFYDRFLSRPAARVADAYAALNGGLHHLIQYLGFLRQDAAWLTARASAPKMIETSKELLERMHKAAVPSTERHLLRATPRDRLLWLSQFFWAPLGSRRDRRFGFAVGLLLAIAAGAALLIAVRDAIDYHPIYVERMRSTQGENPR